MYIIKNAVKNIGRNKGRNILIAVIIFAIILTTSVSIIINTTAAELIKDYKSRFGSEVSIAYDYTKLDYSSAAGYKPLTAEQMLLFGESEYLQSTIIEQTAQINFEDLRALDDGKEGVSTDDSLSTDGLKLEDLFEFWGESMGGFFSTDGASGGGTGSNDSSAASDYLKILGKIIASNQPIISEDFQNGLREIVEGKAYSNENECLVSKQFAELNDLSVGDTIVVKNYRDGSMDHTLTISGIYEDYTMLGDDLGMYELFPSAQYNRNNEILIGFDTAKTMELMKDPMVASVSATYYLQDPSDLGAYEQELREKGLPSYFKVSTDEYSYNRIVEPVEGLSKTTNTFLIAVLVLGSVILILLSILAIRERKYEIGVLRAMGMKKGKVAMGLICEMLVITCLCLALGLGVGSVASQPVADSLLESQIEQVENSNNGMAAPIPIGGNAANTTPLTELEVGLNANAVVQIVLISLALAGVSSLVGILYITKYEPMKILSERN